MPNSPLPLLHYPGYLRHIECQPGKVFDLFSSNGWLVQWITRYSETQDSHYHSEAHECMAVLSGRATIRFGVADTTEDMEENTHGSGFEAGGIELQAEVGDVFVLPSGLAHKTFDPVPVADFRQLLPGQGHFIKADGGRDTIANTELSGFTMIAAYPAGSKWNFKRGGEHEGEFEKVWSVPLPDKDPVLGKSLQGVCGRWNQFMGSKL